MAQTVTGSLYPKLVEAWPAGGPTMPRRSPSNESSSPTPRSRIMKTSTIGFGSGYNDQVPPDAGARSFLATEASAL